MKLSRDDLARIKSSLGFDGRITIEKIINRIEAMRDSLAAAEDRELGLNLFTKRNPIDDKRRETNR